MYVKLKKVIIIFIFLISIIIMLLYKNYNLQQDFYNILVISDKDDLTKQSLTQILWDDLADLTYTNDSFDTKNINYKYLEAKKSKNFKAAVDDNVKTNDLFIVIGDTYNDVIKEVASTYPDIKFLLIENTENITSTNIYNINIKWEDIYVKIKKYLLDERARLIEAKKLKQDEKLNVYIFDENIEKVNELQKTLGVDTISLQTFTYKDFTKEEFEDLYKNQEELYIINFSFEDELEIITKLLKIQKDNMYDYYESITNKKAIEYNQDDTDKQSDEKDLKEEVKYIPIHYIGLYDGDINVGVYDDILEEDIKEKNILVFDFDIDYKTSIANIILEEDAKKDYELNVEDETLKFDIIN